MFSLNKNLIIRLQPDKLLHLYNTENRANIFFSDHALVLLNEILNIKDTRRIKKIFKRNIKIRFLDKTDFTIWKNLYENANFLSTERNSKEKLERINLREFFEKLIERKIVYRNKTVKKKEIFKKYQGDLNNQLLVESFYRKTKLHVWWERQKFKSLKQLKNTPYKFVQSDFLIKYFKKNLKNKSVLEVGCGNGYYCYQMSRFAKKVVGLDYEKDYIKLAQKKKSRNLEFINFDLSKSDKLTEIFNGKRFDFIFMVDFFLFMFQKNFQKNLFINRFRIFNQIKKILKDNGKVIIVDPHLFWLTPFFGNDENPFGILTDYNVKKFSTTPSLQTSANFFNKCGFLISNIYEPAVNKKYKKINKKNFNFFKNFPQWIVYEISKK